MTKYVAKFQTLVATNERGATIVEYGLLIALIAVALIATIGALTGNITGLFNKVGSTLNPSSASS